MDKKLCNAEISNATVQRTSALFHLDLELLEVPLESLMRVMAALIAYFLPMRMGPETIADFK